MVLPVRISSPVQSSSMRMWFPLVPRCASAGARRPADPVADRLAHHQLQVAAAEPGQFLGEHRHAFAVAAGHAGVSRPEELHLRPLSEPDVNLSAHPAPIIQPTTDTPATNERSHPAAFAPSA